MLKSLKSKLLSSTLATTATSLAFSTAAYASGDVATELGLGNSTATDIGKKALGAGLGPLKIFGGVMIAFSIVSIGLGLLMANKLPQKRQEIVSAIPWVFVASFLIGSASMLAGFVINVGK